MTDLVANPTWHRSEDIAVVEHDDRVVALDLTRPAAPPVVLEGTAAAIWHLLDEAKSEARLVDAIADVFDVHPADVRADVHAFLVQLEGLGLVTSSGESE